MKLPQSLFDTSWQWTKLGAALYVLGLLISSLHFIRFEILSIDLLRPQSILVGFFFLGFYAALPALVLCTLKNSPSILLTALTFAGVIVAKEMLLYWQLKSIPLTITLLLAFFQFVLFARFHREQRRLRLLFDSTLGGVTPPAVLLILLIIFSTFVYGEIPGYLAGGRPTPVHIFTDNQELPANRFTNTRNRPQRNPSIPSFKLNLLYEADDYLYFVAIQDTTSAEGYQIMRLRRDEVLRIDYVTPVWFNLGEQE